MSDTGMEGEVFDIPGDDVPEIGDDLSDREAWLNDPAHVNIEVLFPDEEPA